MKTWHATGSFARTMRRPWQPAAVVSLCCLMLGAVSAHDGNQSVSTRYGTVNVDTGHDLDADRSELRVQGKPVAQLDGDVSLYKLSVHHRSDFVLADGLVPGLHCRHQFTLVEIRPEGPPVISGPFGQCMTLFGARLVNGLPVVQLTEAAARQGPDAKNVHEFAVKDGQVTELPKALSQCQANALASAPGWTPVARDRARRSIAGNGRAYFHAAPMDQCRDASLFLVPGDSVNARQEYDGYTEVEYVNARSGRRFVGWIRRDRLTGQPGR